VRLGLSIILVSPREILAMTAMEISRGYKVQRARSDGNAPLEQGKTFVGRAGQQFGEPPQRAHVVRIGRKREPEEVLGSTEVALRHQLNAFRHGHWSRKDIRPQAAFSRRRVRLGRFSRNRGRVSDEVFDRAGVVLRDEASIAELKVGGHARRFLAPPERGRHPVRAGRPVPIAARPRASALTRGLGSTATRPLCIVPSAMHERRDPEGDEERECQGNGPRKRDERHAEQRDLHEFSKTQRLL